MAYEVPNEQEQPTEPFKITSFDAHFHVDFPLVQDEIQKIDEDGNPVYIHFETGEETNAPRSVKSEDRNGNPAEWADNDAKMIPRVRVKADGSTVPVYKGATAKLSVGRVGANGVPVPAAVGTGDSLKPETLEALMTLLIGQEIPRAIADPALKVDGIAQAE